MAETLTATQLADIRLVCVDSELQDNGNTILTDTQIQALYELAQGQLILTYIYCLRRVAGYYGTRINTTSVDFGYTNTYRDLYLNTKQLLTYYTDIYNSDESSPLTEGATATNINTQGIGTLDLFIDTVDD